jgi:hypothetical protein
VDLAVNGDAVTMTAHIKLLRDALERVLGHADSELEQRQTSGNDEEFVGSRLTARRLMKRSARRPFMNRLPSCRFRCPTMAVVTMSARLAAMDMHLAATGSTVSARAAPTKRISSSIPKITISPHRPQAGNLGH